MVEGKFFSGKDDLKEIFQIRKEVFVEELGEETDRDEKDKISMHALAYADGMPVATGRIRFDGWEFVIDKVAVKKAYRGMQYGDFIVRLLIDRAMMAGQGEIKLICSKKNIDFFRKIGFDISVEITESDGQWNEMILDPTKIHKCCQNK
mgnify:CR=1 FL=1